MPFDYERWKAEQFHAMEQETASPVSFPASITFAGMIWIAIGALTLLSLVVVERAPSPGAILGGLLFLYGGIRATRGTSPGMLGSGIGSLLLGVTWVAVGPAIASLRNGSDAVVLLVCVGLGGALILAGFLALMGRSNYQKWREARTSAALRSRGT